MGQRLAKRPRGADYAGLSRRGRVIYFETTKGGKRVKVSLETEDWAEALEAKRILLNRQAEKRRNSFGSSPTFAQAACDHLCDLAHLSNTTKRNRREYLRGAKELVMGDEPENAGPLVAHFGLTRLDEITPAAVRDFWVKWVDGEGRAKASGRNQLVTLSQVFETAIDREQIAANPVPLARAMLKRKTRSKQGRSESLAKVNPLTIDELAELYRVAEDHSQKATVIIKLLAETGMRGGELRALRWGDVEWGQDAEDLTRSVRIDWNIPSGEMEEERPKSGQPRTVSLSKTLRAALRLWWVEQGQPGASERVVPGFHQRNFRARLFAFLAKRAGVRGHTPKDLRDTFGSQLLTAGVQLAYISKQLGHADVATTAKHYARQVEGQAYRTAEQLAADELPADLFARLVNNRGGGKTGAQTPTTSPTTPTRRASGRVAGGSIL